MATENVSSAPETADPWGAATQSATDAANNDPWSTATNASTSGSDWLNSAQVQPESFDWMHPFKDAIIPFDHWVETALNWLVTHGRPLFQAVRVPIDFILSSFEGALVTTPAPIMLLILFLFVVLFARVSLLIASNG